MAASRPPVAALSSSSTWIRRRTPPWLGVDPETVTHNAGDVLLRQVTFEDAVLPTNTAGVTLLPGSVDRYVNSGSNSAG